MSRVLPVNTAVTVLVNLAQLIDDTDFKTREESVVYNQAGLDLVWNFETLAGVISQTAVVPTDTGGLHDWTNIGNGFYKMEIPAASGTINNNAIGFGYLAGFATGILPWIGPTYAFVPQQVIDGIDDTVNPIVVEFYKYLAVALRKDSAAATDLAAYLTNINQNFGSGAGAYVNTTDALEASRDALTTVAADASSAAASGVSTGALVATIPIRVGLQKNTAFTAFPFVMLNATTGVPMAGLSVTAQRSLDGAAFAACANAVTEIASGAYKINLANTDTNANAVILRFTAALAKDLLIAFISTTP